MCDIYLVMIFETSKAVTNIYQFTLNMMSINYLR